MATSVGVGLGPRLDEIAAPLFCAARSQRGARLRTLFKIDDLSIAKGRKLAVVGANGCGKSTLLSYFSGREQPKEGQIRLQPDVRITVVEQSPKFDSKKTVLDTIYEKANTATAQVAHDFRVASALGGEALIKAMEKMEEMPEAWTWDEHVGRVAEELGISKLLQRSMGSLSGGEERRVALAAALVDLPQTDLLILDEPTNHLSAEGCRFLEDTLRSARDVSLVLVSHDRYFLDSVCDQIFEIDWNGETFMHPGSWETFLKRRAERYELRAGEVQDAKVQLRRAEEWARRGPSGRGTKNKAQMDAVGELRQRAREVIKANEGSPDLQDKLLKGKGLAASSSGLVGRIALKDIVVNVNGRNVLNNISVTFEKGEKLGIVGPNGAGKSTLLKTIVGDLQPESGEVFIGQGVLIGFLSQSPPAWPDPKKRVIEVVTDMATVAMTQAEDGVLVQGAEAMSLERRRAAMLKAVNFAQGRWSTPVSLLSGGETLGFPKLKQVTNRNRRLQLLRVLVERPNVLILDEPTNDLDAVTVDSLESMLQRYPGTLILVSHDRSLKLYPIVARLDGVCSSFLVMQEDGSQPKEWTGSFNDLMEQQRKSQPSKLAEVKEKVVVSKVSQKRQDKKLEREMVRLDKRISELEEKLASIDAKMAELWDPWQLEDQPEELEKLMAERDDAETVAWVENGDQEQIEVFERFEQLMSHLEDVLLAEERYAKTHAVLWPSVEDRTAVLFEKRAKARRKAGQHLSLKHFVEDQEYPKSFRGVFSAWDVTSFGDPSTEEDEGPGKAWGVQVVKCAPGVPMREGDFLGADLTGPPRLETKPSWQTILEDASALENVELWSIFGIPCSSAAEAGGPEAEAHLCRLKAMVQLEHCKALAYAQDLGSVQSLAFWLKPTQKHPGLWGPWQALGPVGVTWCEKPPPLEEEMAEKFGGMSAASILREFGASPSQNYDVHKDPAFLTWHRAGGTDANGWVLRSDYTRRRLEAQMAVAIAQLELAKELSLPVILQVPPQDDAERSLAELLVKVFGEGSTHPMMLSSFHGRPHCVPAFMKSFPGMMVGFSGLLTHSKLKTQLGQVAYDVPMEPRHSLGWRAGDIDAGIISMSFL
ncbi:unnamed protein product [Cladocopium goreaui]|uniref:Uncharacterized ABC transporter ATP-binding protein YfmR n=1 Tax=Cladocopium goreaui TaxID=2562237 RepID=A0A9P1D0P6_9DINO|nr:unnamed protein product [Cladocopium goreaui]